MIKSLFLFPPEWSLYSVSTGIPYIMGYLKNFGYEVSAVDLNIKLFHYISHNKNLLKDLTEFYLENREEEKSELKKLFIDEDNKYIKLSKHILRHKEKFIYKNLRKKANITIFNYIKMFNSIFSDKEKREKFLSLNLDFLNIFLLEQIKDKDINSFDFIGFSVNSNVQLFFSEIFAKLLRKNGYKNKIALGGTEISIIKDSPKILKDLFDSGIDYAVEGAGEEPIKEILEYLENKREITEISGLIYRINEQIVHNQQQTKTQAVHFFPNYSGYNFNDYLNPEPVLPVRVSFGCYYGKCHFCCYSQLGEYYPKTTEQISTEIQDTIKNWKVNNFYFVDAALPPQFLIKFADEIIKSKTEIYYYTNLRFEENFTREVLEKLYKSGLRYAGWGLESGSQKVINEMNKGIKIQTAQRILKDCAELGINNHLYLIYGFPTETKEDFEETCGFIEKNIQYIHTCAPHMFELQRDTYIFQHPENFGINSETVKNLFRDKNIYNLAFSDVMPEKEEELREKWERLSEVIQQIIHDGGGLDSFLLESKFKQQSFIDDNNR